MSMQQRGEHHIERMAGVSERGVDHIERMDGPEILNSVDQIGFTLNVLNINSLDVRTGESGNTE
jgi:hypothetical protein